MEQVPCGVGGFNFLRYLTFTLTCNLKILLTVCSNGTCKVWDISLNDILLVVGDMRSWLLKSDRVWGSHYVLVDHATGVSGLAG